MLIRKKPNHECVCVCALLLLPYMPSLTCCGDNNNYIYIIPVSQCPFG